MRPSITVPLSASAHLSRDWTINSGDFSHHYLFSGEVQNERMIHTGADSVVTANSVRQMAVGDNAFTSEDWLAFRALRAEWRRECGVTSSLTKIVAAPSYLRIIGMGAKSLPLVLHELESEGDDPDWWFSALEALTGYDPVSERDRGNTEAMARAWLTWARENNAR